ncbi:hypothetical protein [Mycobacterium sp.]|uniref:hypothetical protein n=1 Tax=Mycobacterium sp. TaxID=1785 RepID=UPI003F954594
MGDPRQLSTSAASPTPVHENTTDESNLADALRNELRQLRIELSIATRRVAAATGLNDSDLDVLDVLARYGAQSPTSLARRMGIHLTALYREANERLDEIAAQLTPEAGEVILDYLGRVCAAVHEASTRLAVGGSTR